MATIRQQVLIEAPVEEVWSLIGDVQHYPDWWPSFIEIDGETFEEGSEFVQLSHDPIGSGTTRTRFVIDDRTELRELRMHCTLSGAYAHWQLTEAQGGTFIEVEGGAEAPSLRYKLFDAALGRVAWRRWIREAVEGLERVATASDPARR